MVTNLLRLNDPDYALKEQLKEDIAQRHQVVPQQRVVHMDEFVFTEEVLENFIVLTFDGGYPARIPLLMAMVGLPGEYTRMYGFIPLVPSQPVIVMVKSRHYFMNVVICSSPWAVKQNFNTSVEHEVHSTGSKSPAHVWEYFV